MRKRSNLFLIPVLALLAPYTVLSPALAQQADPTPLSDPIQQSINQGELSIDLTLIADNLATPIGGMGAPGVIDFLFFIEQSGSISSIQLDENSVSEVANLNILILTGSERGLIGLAFHPEFATNGLLYTHTSEPSREMADFSNLPSDNSANHFSVISEWQALPDPQLGITIDLNSKRELLTIAQPQANHNGGSLVFDDNQYLLIAIGDGGGSDDQGTGHSEGGNGQDNSNVLGTILRINPLGRDSANGQYGIPSDNPFFGSEIIHNEIFAFGFRNPFRVSFDAVTGQLYVGDVGQNDIEEVSIVQAGQNLGWPLREGSFGFFNNGNAAGYVFEQAPLEGITDPWAQYDHDEGIAVIGGYVYRGSQVEDLQGMYVFGDLNGRLFYANPDGDIRELLIDNLGATSFNVLAFGESLDRELYVMASGNAAGTGAIYQITPVQQAEPPAPPTTPAPAPQPASSGGGSVGPFGLTLLTALLLHLGFVRVRAKLGK